MLPLRFIAAGGEDVGGGASAAAAAAKTAAAGGNDSFGAGEGTGVEAVAEVLPSDDQKLWTEEMQSDDVSKLIDYNKRAKLLSRIWLVCVLENEPAQQIDQTFIQQKYSGV
jgi:hypothetical protein